MAATHLPPNHDDSEQTRARYPDAAGYVERDGVRIHWERYGHGPKAILLLPTWEIIHSRGWKLQIPYLSRHACVITFDPRGNGRTSRPRDPKAYDRSEIATDAIAVLDAAGVQQVALVSWCAAAEDLILATQHPDRITSLITIAPNLLLTDDPEQQAGFDFDAELTTDAGWAKSNRHYWLRDWTGYVEFFFSKVFTEPHSTKQIEDSVGWAQETDPETILLGIAADWRNDREQSLELCAKVRCPTIVVQGSADEVVGPDRGPAVAAAIPGARLVMFEGSGHGIPAREPVQLNQLIRAATCALDIPSRWPRAQTRRRRALFVSSPIGLGHVRRDVAIADALRALRPGLQIEWLAQPPVTAVLETRGELIHPMSVHLANESHHMQREAHGHELRCFEAMRRMDEIQLANFMVFKDLVADEPYDLWIGDEAWEIDHYLHENPELKRAPFAWLTDFVGYLPMPDAGPREAILTADYNAEMLEHIDRHPHVRDRAIFVGDPDDIVPDAFGAELPLIRDWTTEHFDFSGYIKGFDPSSVADRASLRAELGYRADESVCVVCVGGSGVGVALLRRVIDAYPHAKQLVPGLRMVVVAGPRIDLGSLPSAPGLELRPYVDGLYRNLAACDLAVVQGGLATCMELTATGRPFLYFPLKGHFEQSLHVHHRLRRHDAGRRLDFDTVTSEDIAVAIAAEIGRDADYLPVADDGAERAAAILADLL